MFNIFKTKEEKQKKLQRECDLLNNKYVKEIDSYCKIYEHIFFLKSFQIKDNQIVVVFKDKNTAEGYNNYLELNWWKLKYGNTDFQKTRINFIKFKKDLNKIGLKLEKL